MELGRLSNRVVLLSTVETLDSQEGLGGRMFMPLSIMALGTVLKANGFEPRLLDTQVLPDWKNALRATLPGALLFGVSCYTGHSILAVLDAIAIAKAEAPEVPIVWGGYHATLAYRSIFKEKLVDYAVLGQGEEGLLGLARALRDGRDHADVQTRLKEVQNLVYECNSKILVNKTTRIRDMSSLPSMNYGLIDVEQYFTSERREVSYVSSYGCPYACSFCAEPTQSGQSFQAFSAHRVVNELLDLWATYRPDRVCLVDPNFSSAPKRVVEIVRGLQDRNARIEIFCDMRASDVLHISKLIDLAELGGVGFRQIYLGLESGSDHMLRSLRKGFSSEVALEACRLLDKAGIETITGFIHDLPSESAEDSRLTLDLAENLCHLDTNRQSHHFFMPYPSTEIFNTLTARADLESRSQVEWAQSSTQYGSEIWPGNTELRRSVIRTLADLKQRYPHAFFGTTFPTLARIELERTVWDLLS